MSRPQKPTAAQKTAKALRADILAIGTDGAFLGSEDELLVRYGVSRPTLRQAARVLEHEQLLTVRRGVNGGIFTRLPTNEAVVHVAAVYLQANGMTIRKLQQAVLVIAPAIARLAATNPDPAARAELLTWVQSWWDERPTRPRELLASAAEVSLRIGDLADSPALSVFSAVLMEIAVAESDFNVFATPDRIESVNVYHLEVARAIRFGHATKAEQLSRDNLVRTEQWMPAA